MMTRSALLVPLASAAASVTAHDFFYLGNRLGGGGVYLAAVGGDKHIVFDADADSMQVLGYVGAGTEIEPGLDG